LDDELLNDARKAGALIKDSDDDDDDYGIDRSLTMEQLVILYKQTDTLSLQDFGLPERCDRLLYEHSLYDNNQKFHIPSVIASYDSFQRMSYTDYCRSWPSLFIGREGSNSQLHLDSGATGFCMYLVSVRKRWIVYNQSERPALYDKIEGQAVYPDVLAMNKDDESND
jgi:hypothetical protein